MNVQDLYKGSEFSRDECIELYTASIRENPKSYEEFKQIWDRLAQKKREAKKAVWDKISDK